MVVFRNTLFAAASAAMLAGCAGSEPRVYAGIPSTALMVSTTGATTAGAPRIAYRARPDVFAGRHGVRLEPIDVHRGTDRRFADLSGAEVDRLAAVAATAFRTALAERHLLVDDRGAGVLRLRVVLTGAEPTVPGLATVTRLTPVGFALNGVKAAGGIEGGFTGSVDYVVEVRDDATGELLSAFGAKGFPSALDLPAGIGRLTVAEVGLRRGAEVFAADLAREIGGARAR